MPSADPRLRSLRRLNLIVGVAHLLQAAAILLLANDFAIPVRALVQDGPPGTDLTLEATFFEVRFSYMIALFLLLAAIDHLLTAAPRIVDWYEANLARGINYARWVEYSVSASLMIVLIAMLTGITNLYAIIALFAVNATMILFGLLMERTNRPGDPVDWWPFSFGAIAGTVPWLAIGVALIASGSEGGGAPPFVYAIFVSLFALFNCFGANQWLQFRRRGRHADYLFGEQVYLILSVAAKSALAWQVYAGTLAGSSA